MAVFEPKDIDPPIIRLALIHAAVGFTEYGLPGISDNGFFSISRGNEMQNRKKRVFITAPSDLDASEAELQKFKEENERLKKQIVEAADLLKRSDRELEKARADSFRVRTVRLYLDATRHFQTKLPDCMCPLCIVAAAIDYKPGR